MVSTYRIEALLPPPPHPVPPPLPSVLSSPHFYLELLRGAPFLLNLLQSLWEPRSGLESPLELALSRGSDSTGWGGTWGPAFLTSLLGVCAANGCHVQHVRS